MSDAHYRIARKIAGNERLTDADRVELRRNLDAIVMEMRAIFMRERRFQFTLNDLPVNAVGTMLEQK